MKMKLQNQRNVLRFGGSIVARIVLLPVLIPLLVRNTSIVSAAVTTQSSSNINNGNIEQRRIQISSSSSTTKTTALTSDCVDSFVQCSKHPDCNECYDKVYSDDVTWAGVTSTTLCTTFLQSLYNNNYCMVFQSASRNTTIQEAQDVFCQTFTACIQPTLTIPADISEEEDTTTPTTTSITKTTTTTTSVPRIDCSTLTECNWPGMKEYLGDGRCNDIGSNDHTIDGCYNSPICNYDNGDCCPDTCRSKNGKVKLFDHECGSNMYTCRDPKSVACDTQTNIPAPEYAKVTSLQCFQDGSIDKSVAIYSNDNNYGAPVSQKKPTPVCNLEKEEMYVLNLYDTFGNGWDNSYLTISYLSSVNSITEPVVVYNTTLSFGSYSTESFCLPRKDPSSNIIPWYTVEVRGVMWGRERSWEIKSSTGGPIIASGVAPTNCQFTLSGARDPPKGGSGMSSYDVPVCLTTIQSGSTLDMSRNWKDHAYDQKENLSLLDMSACIEKKCFVQSAACQNNDECKICFQETVPAWCYSVDAFTALTDCTMCKCTDMNSIHYCATKVTITNTNEGIISPPEVCSPTMKQRGGNAVMEYTTCTNFNTFDILLRYFDEEDFGLLDMFEICASDYYDDPKSRSALGCLQILVNSMHPESHVKNKTTTISNGNTNDDDSIAGEGTYPYAIAELAKQLYYNGQEFCDCTERAYNQTPSCPTFINFKTLLYESLSSCTALDEIDCAAWKEFAIPCTSKMQQKFGTIDFTKSEQCEYIHDTCGGTGPFPSFRRLDCQSELGTSLWEFYTQYYTSCLKPTTTTATTSTLNVNDVPVANTDDGFVMPKGEEPKRQYIPPEQRKKDTVTSLTSKQQSSYVTEQNETTTNKNSSKKSKLPSLLWIVVFGCIGYITYHRRNHIWYFLKSYRPVQSQFTLGNNSTADANPFVYEGDIALSSSNAEMTSPSSNSFQSL